MWAECGLDDDLCLHRRDFPAAGKKEDMHPGGIKKLTP